MLLPAHKPCKHVREQRPPPCVPVGQSRSHILQVRAASGRWVRPGSVGRLGPSSRWRAQCGIANDSGVPAWWPAEVATLLSSQPPFPTDRHGRLANGTRQLQCFLVCSTVYMPHQQQGAAGGTRAIGPPGPGGCVAAQCVQAGGRVGGAALDMHQAEQNSNLTTSRGSIWPGTAPPWEPARACSEVAYGESGTMLFEYGASGQCAERA